MSGGLREANQGYDFRVLQKSKNVRGKGVPGFGGSAAKQAGGFCGKHDTRGRSCPGPIGDALPTQKGRNELQSLLKQEINDAIDAQSSARAIKLVYRDAKALLICDAWESAPVATGHGDKQTATWKNRHENNGKQKAIGKEKLITYSILGVAELLDVNGHSGLGIVLSGHDCYGWWWR